MLDALAESLADQEYYAPLATMTDPGPRFSPSRPAPAWLRVEQDIWTVWSEQHSHRPEQGWKIHVSARLDRAQQVLDRVAEVCFAEGVPFKHISARTFFLVLHHKHAHRAQAGKFCAIYPPDTGTARRLLGLLWRAAAAPGVGPGDRHGRRHPVLRGQRRDQARHALSGHRRGGRGDGPDPVRRHRPGRNASLRRCRWWRPAPPCRPGPRRRACTADHADHAEADGGGPARAAAVRSATGLLKYAVPHTRGVRFLGSHAHRFSADLSSGAAGVLLALHRVLHGPGDEVFTLDPAAGTPARGRTTTEEENHP